LTRQKSKSGVEYASKRKRTLRMMGKVFVPSACKTEWSESMRTINEVNAELRKLYAEREKIQRAEYKDFIDRAYHIPETVIYVLVIGMDSKGFRVVHYDEETGDLITQTMDFGNSIFMHEMPADEFIARLEDRIGLIKQGGTQ
jgi:hypothetical protein